MAEGGGLLNLVLPSRLIPRSAKPSSFVGFSSVAPPYHSLLFVVVLRRWVAIWVAINFSDRPFHCVGDYVVDPRVVASWAAKASGRTHSGGFRSALTISTSRCSRNL